MMMWSGGHGWGWAGWILMTVGMVAFWALVITAVILAIHYLVRDDRMAARPSSLGHRLKKRLPNASVAARSTTLIIDRAAPSYVITPGSGIGFGPGRRLLMTPTDRCSHCHGRIVESCRRLLKRGEK